MPEKTRREQWYSNKELKEMIDGLKSDLKDTRFEIKKYNNLVNKMSSAEQHLQNVENKIDEQVSICTEVQAKKEGKADLYGLLLKLWPVIISTVIFILSMTNIL